MPARGVEAERPRQKTPAVMNPLARRIAEVVGRAHVLTDPAELLTYEADGLMHGRTRAGLVV
ncbi:MAG TPA: hypothetical protein VFG59_18170, partial [Anaeromyxobacter sp.]|nr:hypothetical protein [Anaeromyxobacter sp.]